MSCHRRQRWCKAHVPNPHEGLWEFQQKGTVWEKKRSKSPWGVMRDYCTPQNFPISWFQIPMRGYEAFRWTASRSNRSVPNPHEGLWDRLYTMSKAACYCSKSPWGVMRIPISRAVKEYKKFQIPMRGYEVGWNLVVKCPIFVPNPHEGLWVASLVVSEESVSGSKSPWGVMRSHLQLPAGRPECSKSPWGVMRLI